jgi:hypothetical protein
MSNSLHPLRCVLRISESGRLFQSPQFPARFLFHQLSCLVFLVLRQSQTITLAMYQGCKRFAPWKDVRTSRAPLFPTSSACPVWHPFRVRESYLSGYRGCRRCAPQPPAKVCESFGLVRQRFQLFAKSVRQRFGTSLLRSTLNAPDERAALASSTEQELARKKVQSGCE